MKLQRRVLRALAALLLLILIGTLGYMLIEGWGSYDAVYMTVITISTVGYKEVAVLSNAGRAFTCFLIVGGVGVMFYVVTGMVGDIVEQSTQGIFRRRRMENQISKLKDHSILCGYGRVGKEIAITFSMNKVPFVIVDPDDAALAAAREDRYLYLLGSGSSDEMLEKAGISRARGLIAAAGSDAENLFITLSAKAINPGAFIVARACDEDTIPKLERAGADKVILPLRIGGRHIAMLAMRPLVLDFIDSLFGVSPLQLEEIKVVESSPLSGREVGEAEKLAGLTILALRKKDGILLFKPDAETSIGADDELLVIGRREKLEKVETEAMQAS